MTPDERSRQAKRNALQRQREGLQCALETVYEPDIQPLRCRHIAAPGERICPLHLRLLPVPDAEYVPRKGRHDHE